MLLTNEIGFVCTVVALAMAFFYVSFRVRIFSSLALMAIFWLVLLWNQQPEMQTAQTQEDPRLAEMPAVSFSSSSASRDPMQYVRGVWQYLEVGQKLQKLLVNPAPQ